MRTKTDDKLPRVEVVERAWREVEIASQVIFGSHNIGRDFCLFSGWNCENIAFLVYIYDHYKIQK
jgi:hypothetical protein